MANNRWTDDDFEDNNEENSEFWMEFVDPNNMGIPIEDIISNREEEFVIAHKQLNIDILDKSITMAKGCWLWYFMSTKRKSRLVSKIYRELLQLIHEG
jgi:hypothetical protein